MPTGAFEITVAVWSASRKSNAPVGIKLSPVGAWDSCRRHLAVVAVACTVDRPFAAVVLE